MASNQLKTPTRIVTTGERMVTTALAIHLGTGADGLSLEHDLERDLGLDPLDLVLIALRFEDAQEAEFPMRLLAHVKTVADLVLLVQSWQLSVAMERRSRRAFAFERESAHVG